ncbi:MAG TPA: hypothetical protein VG936_08365 [Lacunisphaera sp.]|nr:hypothetical protein [Lacunisphaera sp.]
MKRVIVTILFLESLLFAVAADDSWQESRLFAAGLKHSDIALMPEGTPEDLRAFAPLRPTVVAWGDDGLSVLEGGEKARARLAQKFATYRKMGVRLRAANVFMLSPTIGYLDAHPEFWDTICVDLWGEKVQPKWTKNWWGCTNNPMFQEQLMARMRAGLETGANIIHLDDHAGTYACASWGGGCFCRYCMQGFRAWLHDHVDAKELAAAGVDDVATFDLREFLSKRGYGDRKAFMDAVFKRTVPLWDKFLTFQRESEIAFIRRMQTEAARVAGHPVPFGVNSFNLIPVQVFEAHCVDYFANEVEHYDVEDLVPPVVYRLGEAIGRPTFSTGAGWDWVKVGQSPSTTRVRGWIAEAYAFGQYFMYAWGKWAWSESSPTNPLLKVDPEIFRPMFAFVSDHSELFDGLENAATVGLLFDSATAARNHWDVRDASKAMLDAGVPYGLAVSGDELLKRPLTREALNRFRVLVLPKDIKRTEALNQLLAQWQESGGILIDRSAGDPEIGKLPGRIEVKCAGRVWALPRAPRDATKLVVHFLNRDYDAAHDLMKEKRAIAVALAPASLGGPSSIRRVRYFAPGVEPRDLAFHSGGDGTLRFELPLLNLWGIAEIE